MTNGTANSDFLVGSDGNDLIYGFGGSDIIFGKDGADVLFGGSGDDLLVGGRGNDTLYGGAGFDVANYNDASFGIFAEMVKGTVTIKIGPGDTVETDTLVGIEGITGGGGNDFINGDANDNILSGMVGNDQLWGGYGNDKLYGGAGKDILFGGPGADLLHGGPGSDMVAYFNNPVGVKIDLATGTASGGWANGDILVSIESVDGSDLNDRLTGDGQDNYLNGELGDDILKGGAGDDFLVGGEGGDVLNGGQGFDIINYNSSSGGVTIDLAAQTASGGAAQGDTISSIEEVDASGFADTLLGSGADNRFYGLDGDDALKGRGGADYLDGGNGDDMIVGGGGDDIIIGGTGRDVMTGGSGEDRFYFNSLLEAGNGAATRDVVTDFQEGIDHVGLYLIDADTNTPGRQSFTFIGNGEFNKTAGELHTIVENGKTILEGDVNGDKIADFQIEFYGIITFTGDDLLL